MNKNELFVSVVAKLAVHFPLLAKGLVEIELSKVGATPATVTPLQMKKALEEYILPKLSGMSKDFQENELIGGGIIRTTQDNRIVNISPGISRYLGSERNIDGKVQTLFDKLQQFGLVTPVEAFLKTGMTHIFSRVNLASPYKSVLDVAMVLISGEKGEPLGTVSLIRDITLTESMADEISLLYRKIETINAELHESEEQLRKKNLEILDFANNVTHDLKKPLTTMKMLDTINAIA